MGQLTSERIAPAFRLPTLALLASLLAACTVPGQMPRATGDTSEIAAPPQSLIGLTPGLLNATFGQPTLRRVDGTAQVWLYHSASCGLNLFLYPDATGVPRVTLATTADGSPAIGDCPANLEQSHIDAVSEMPAAATLEPPASS
jgi:hypothetical protein